MNRYPLHHVGILIPTREQAEAFCKKFCLEADYGRYVELYQADCITMKRRPNETAIELVIPRGGILSLFNNGKSGIHHIAFQVDDIEAVRQEYAAMGMVMLEEKAVPGSKNILVNFLRPRDAEGILVEFIQEVSPEVFMQAMN